MKRVNVKIKRKYPKRTITGEKINQEGFVKIPFELYNIILLAFLFIWIRMIVDIVKFFQ